jgi:hypothetical protein
VGVVEIEHRAFLSQPAAVRDLLLNLWALPI